MTYTRVEHMKQNRLSAPQIALLFLAVYTVAQAALISIHEFYADQYNLEEMGYHKCECHHENHECVNVLTPLYPFAECVMCTFSMCQVALNA